MLDSNFPCMRDDPCHVHDVEFTMTLYVGVASYVDNARGRCKAT